MNSIEIKVLKIIRIIVMTISLKVKASAKIKIILKNKVDKNEYFKNHLKSSNRCAPWTSSNSSRVEGNNNKRGRIYARKVDAAAWIPTVLSAK